MPQVGAFKKNPQLRDIYSSLSKKVQIAWICAGSVGPFINFTFFLFAVCCDLICGERLMKRCNLQQERNGASYPFDIPDRIHLLSV
jgi:hypothetical protein